jgi:hypothetical protein
VVVANTTRFVLSSANEGGSIFSTLKKKKTSV